MNRQSNTIAAKPSKLVIGLVGGLWLVAAVAISGQLQAVRAASNHSGGKAATPAQRHFTTSGLTFHELTAPASLPLHAELPRSSFIDQHSLQPCWATDQC